MKKSIIAAIFFSLATAAMSAEAEKVMAGYLECLTIGEESVCITKVNSENFENLSVWHIPQEVTVDNTTYQVTEIGDNAFEGQTKFKEIVLPASIEKIGKQAFMDCSNLKFINLPGAITSIGKEAFAGCELQMIITDKLLNTLDGLEESLQGADIDNMMLQIPIENIDALKGVDFLSDYSAVKIIMRPLSVALRIAYGSSENYDSYYETRSNDVAFVVKNNREFSIGWLFGVGGPGLMWPVFDGVEIQGEQVKSFYYDNDNSGYPIGQYFTISGIDQNAEFHATCYGSGVDSLIENDAEQTIFDINGTIIKTDVNLLPHGLYLLKKGNKTTRILK